MWAMKSSLCKHRQLVGGRPKTKLNCQPSIFILIPTPLLRPGFIAMALEFYVLNHGTLTNYKRFQFFFPPSWNFQQEVGFKNSKRERRSTRAPCINKLTDPLDLTALIGSRDTMRGFAPVSLNLDRQKLIGKKRPLAKSA